MPRHLHAGIWTLLVLAAGMALVNVSMRYIADRLGPESPAGHAIRKAY